MTEEQTPEPEPVQIDETEALKNEMQDYKDKYLRALAESDNMRKRLQKEKQEMTSYAISQIVTAFLGPIDHMENALKYTQQMSEEVKHWSLGFQMILTQLKDVLSDQGVQAFESVGQAFDPHLHEAVETETREGINPGIVIEEFVRGYKMGERIIRPARVKVAK
jgi:molecular chaperone GrpE